MKKFLTLFSALILLGSLMTVSATDYYVAHNGNLGGQSWNTEKEIMTSNGSGEYYRTYFAVPASAAIQFKVAKDKSWTGALGSSKIDNTKSDITLGGSDNIEFTNSALQNITIWTNGTKVWVKVNDPIIKQHVLNGTKVMFYYGSPTGWGADKVMYFSTSNKKPNESGAVYESGKAPEWKSGYYSAIGLYALNSSTPYYLSNNNDWAGNSKSGLTAGCFADMSASVTGNTSFVCTLSSTSYAITEGAADAGIGSTVSGKSGLGLNYSLDHYYYSADGTTWNELPSDVSGLAVGSYTVKALATDGHIYMVSTNSATLTVSAYIPGAHDITATAATKWTYGSLPASETAGETVEFTVTPDAGYSVEVSSSDVTITKNGNTYSFIMPDNDVAISVAATALSYNITYPASPSHYTLAAGNPTSGNTDAAINITVTPDAHYVLTVTANGTELTGVSNVYSFTMPAEAVTIAVTAQSYRTFDGSTPLYLNAAAINWWCNDNAVQHATFVKEDNSEVVVTGVVEEGKIYAFTPESGYYKSVKFSRHNPSNVSEDWGHTDYISLVGTEANDYITAFAQNASTATWSTFVPSPSYTFTAGTKIYYDFTAYGSGVDMYPGGNHTYDANTSDEVNSFELAADWKVLETTTLFQSAASSWSPVVCSTLPTAGKNMIVSTDGATYSWGTYVPPVIPTVNFVSLGSTIALDQTIHFAATSTNIDNPVYTFYVKKGTGDYGAAVTSFNFDEAGTYTVKVEVDGDESKHKEATQEVTVVDGAHTIYLVNHAGWAQVYAHMWGASPGTTWPGDLMTLTTSVTAKHQYSVYAVTFTPNYTNVKFNNGLGLETGDLTIDFAKPYYYNGTWYATLDACDPLTAEFSGVADYYLVGANVTLAATSNLTNPSYTYQVKVGEGDFAAATNPYTVAAAGTYTFKVTATGDEGNASATKVVTVHEPLTLYYVNKNDAWTDIHAYAYLAADDNIRNADWTGEPMTNTGIESNHGHDVYSIVIPAGRYDAVIFNNNSSGDGKQTSNLTINDATPYYFDGAWYATLDACDPLILTTNFYLAGSFNDWNTTSDRFMKVNESDTEASVTISITEYSNITFKVMEGAAYCGSSDAITKDANTATIAAAGAGNDIAMTPYAAGDYIFTLNLNTRVLTVTYPDGDAMPIPTNIFLAGEMNSWAPANNDYKFAVSGDIATLEVDLPAEQDYEFKLVYNSTWLRADYDFKYYWCSDVAFSAGDGNGAKIYTFKAGTYTFSYKISTGELSIAYPTTDATPVTIGALEYATFFSNKAFDVPADVEAYIITGNEGIKLTIEPIYRIPANTGVMLHAPAGTYNFYEGDGRWMDAVTNNKLKGSVAAEVIDNGEVHYVLSYNNDNQVGFYWPNGTSASQGKGAFTNGAGKAYLELSDAPAAAVVARRGFPLVVGAGTPTGIEDIESNAEQTKFIQNGQLLIQHNGLIFNAQGARVR